MSTEASGVSGTDLYFDFSRKFLPDRRNKFIKAMVRSPLREGLRRSWRGRQAPGCERWHGPVKGHGGVPERESRGGQAMIELY